jgi:hypothetical protein
MAGGTKADALQGVGRVGVNAVVLLDKLINVNEDFGGRRFTC